MASLLAHSKGPKAGCRYIVFSRGEKRELIYLGKIPERVAGMIHRHVEDLIAASMGGASIMPGTTHWLTKIDASLSDKLANVGLIEPRADATQATLDAFITDYLDKLNVKPGTLFNLNLARRNLVEFFGAEKRLKDITPGDADEWRRWLKRKHSDNTVRRRCGRAKQFFRAAVRKKLIAESPFGDMKDCRVTGNRERDYFISPADAQRVLDACPDTQWRLLFALSRFAGLRCPSEHSALRWADVDFAKGRMTVRSPKTEQYEGKDSRVVPIFPELRPYLEAAKESAAKSAEHVITIPSVAAFRDGGPSPNLGTRMQKIVKRAGLTPWPKLFHNLRATRQTELAQTFPEHVVCEWIGNSQAIAREHYLRVSNADYAKAIGSKSDVKSDVTNPDKATQKETGHTAASSGTLGNAVQKCLEANGFGEIFPAIRDLLQKYQ